MIKVITAEKIEGLDISKKEMFDWVSELIATKKECYLPAKISMKREGHIFYNVMPCILPQYNVAGVKVVNRYPDNKPSLKSNLMLYDLSNGDLMGIMDANYITTMRTGAVAVHSIKLFARENFQVVALIGLGSVTQAALSIFAEVFNDKKYIIKLYRYKDHAEKTIEKYKNNQNLQFVVCNSIKDLMEDSDVIVSGITFAEKDFCDEKYYKPGVTIISIHTLGFQNCDRIFDKVFGDDTEHIRGFKYFKEFKKFNEVCDVVNKKAVGRENNKERILCYNIGVAIHDIYFAKQIMNKINIK